MAAARLSRFVFRPVSQLFHIPRVIVDVRSTNTYNSRPPLTLAQTSGCLFIILSPILHPAVCILFVRSRTRELSDDLVLYCPKALTRLLERIFCWAIVSHLRLYNDELIIDEFSANAINAAQHSV